MPDEVIYAELAESLYREGRFEVLGEPADFLSLVYPSLVGPFLAVDDLERGYWWAKLVQALVMSLAAVPVYLWTRRLATAGWAVVAAALTVAIPGLAYSGLLMTEVVFYPVTVAAAFAMAMVLEGPTAGRMLFLVAAVAVAALTRLQLFVLVPVFATALVAFLVSERRLRDIRRFLPALGGSRSGLRGRRGGCDRGAARPPVRRLRAGRGGPTTASRTAPLRALPRGRRRAAEWNRPGLRAGRPLGLRRAARGRCARTSPSRPRSRCGSCSRSGSSRRASSGTSPSATCCRSRRCCSSASPRGSGSAARVRWPATLVAGVLAVGLLVAMPVAGLVSEVSIHNTFALMPLLELERCGAERRPGPRGRRGGRGRGPLFARLPERRLWVLPLALAIVFIEVGLGQQRDGGARARCPGTAIGSEPRWIDRRADGPVDFLYLGEVNWPAVWQNAFWNRRVERAYGLLTARVVGGLPHVSVGPQEDGRLVLGDGSPTEGEYAVAAYPVTFRGRALESAGKDGLVLWRLDPPARLDVWTQRVAGHVRVLAYGCDGGELRLELGAGAGDRRAAPERRAVPYGRARRGRHVERRRPGGTSEPRRPAPVHLRRPEPARGPRAHGRLRARRPRIVRKREARRAELEPLRHGRGACGRHRGPDPATQGHGSA